MPLYRAHRAWEIARACREVLLFALAAHAHKIADTRRRRCGEAKCAGMIRESVRVLRATTHTHTLSHTNTLTTHALDDTSTDNIIVQPGGAEQLATCGYIALLEGRDVTERTAVVGTVIQPQNARNSHTYARPDARRASRVRMSGFRCVRARARFAAAAAPVRPNERVSFPLGW